MLHNGSKKEAHTVPRVPGEVEKKKQGTVETVTLLDGSGYICPPRLEQFKMDLYLGRLPVNLC